jgi:hypothetical protein
VETAGNMVLTAGQSSGFNATGAAAVLSSAEIKMIIRGERGLQLEGSTSSGIFQAVGGFDLRRVQGRSFPIEISGGISLFGVPMRDDAIFISGAPALNLDALLAAFLRATDTTRQQGFQTDANLRERGDAKSGGGGVCR